MKHVASCTVFVFCINHIVFTLGHYLWLSEDLKGDAVVTFGEVPGAPGPLQLLSMVANKTTLISHDTSSERNVTLVANTSNKSKESDSTLVGRITASPPFSLRLATTFGIFHGGSLLKYWGAADVVTKPNDCFLVQDWAPQAGLEITIRDPYMNNSQSGSGLKTTDPGDECKAHEGPMQDGAACVVAVIRFNGQLLQEKIQVETFTGNGSKLATTQSQSGVVILKVPYNESLPFTSVWARVNYHENKSGMYDGENYTFVDHWATTYCRIVRASSMPPAFVLV